MEFSNSQIGRNISKYRKLKDIKAREMAWRIGLSEAGYTKYERGETAITIGFVQRVARELNVNPIHLIIADSEFILNKMQIPSSKEGGSIENDMISERSPNMLRLLENIVSANQKLALLLEKHFSSCEVSSSMDWQHPTDI